MWSKLIPRFQVLNIEVNSYYVAQGGGNWHATELQKWENT